jgi:hypothetical protein
MASLLPRAAVVVAFAACSSCRPQSADPPLAPQPPATVELGLPSAPAPAEIPPSAGARAAGPAACDPASSFVEIKDGDVPYRYALGRDSHGRGAPHAFAELVIHREGSSVLHIEAIEGTKDGDGILVITVMSLDPRAMPGKIGETRIEYMRPGWTRREREEFVAHELTAGITRFGAVGELVEGSIGPVALTNHLGEETMLTVLLHVCRAADWRVPDR